MERVYFAKSLEDLRTIASQVLEDFSGPGIFLMNGEMGAGKTTFITALCNQLGIEETSSPTFSLVNEYESKDGLCVYHFDLYRMKKIEEAYDIGLDEYLHPSAIVFIEWPELAMNFISPPYNEVHIQELDGVREIKISKIKS